jgi:uncharacterized protein YeaO (DUF488 family)
LAPTAESVKLALTAENERQWAAFIKRYRREMANSENSRVIDLLAALSHQIDFSLGCYCQNEARCHRSVLRRLLADRGAKVI